MPSLFHMWNNASPRSDSAESAFLDRDQFQTASAAFTTATQQLSTEMAADGDPSSANRHANFVWYEDWDDSGADMPIPSPPLYHRYVELSPLLPFGMMLIISAIIFLLIIFRRWPGLVAGIVAGCLTSITIYLLLLSLKEQRLVYE